RSEIFYVSEAQRDEALRTIDDANASGLWPSRVVTKVSPAGEFWEAEPEHQDYLERYPLGYTCHFPRPGWKLPRRGRLRPHCKTSSPLKRAMRPLRPMEAPITMGINHKPAPELLVPYWIDGLGSWWESALYSEAERAALAYCGALTEGNRLNITFDLAPSNDPGLS
ncbi:MAG TPA: peptide-methionine (S)-S-oxide reductase, partial [Rubrobacteraceae bacterium]|nr:peptide-methionine (S)-S-oxide reductase [Rubrobacteraceae bacterium]